jgi:hypothetical protein
MMIMSKIEIHTAQEAVIEGVVVATAVKVLEATIVPVVEVVVPVPVYY